MSLLQADEPAPVTVLRPQGASPFLLTADHAGRLIPRALGTLGLSEAERQRHIAWDIGIAGTTRLLADRLDAVAVLQTYSRLVIDCNRAPHVSSAMPVVSELTDIPGNRNLSVADAAARQAAIFDPYHRRIAGILDDRAAAGRPSILVAMHSFTPVFKGVERPVQVGVLYNRDPRFAHALMALLQAEGDLAVGDNEPYRVSDETDYGIPVHGELRGLLHVEVEIRQDLIGEPEGQLAWADRLARLLPQAASRVAPQ